MTELGLFDFKLSLITRLNRTSSDLVPPIFASSNCKVRSRLMMLDVAIDSSINQNSAYRRSSRLVRNDKLQVLMAYKATDKKNNRGW